MQIDAVTRFLTDRRLTADCYDTAAQVSKFREDMVRGLRGRESSMLMLPTFLAGTDGCPEDGKIIVLDIGGTNLRAGTAVFLNGTVQQLQIEKFPLPGTDRELECHAFFDAAAERLAPYLEESDKIGFCFSYAARCREDGDAELVAFCKEVRVRGAEGVKICRALADAIHRRGVNRKYRIVQLNDTVAAMLGGMAAVDRTQYDGFIGCVLGTGTNICYRERTAAIGKYTGSAYREETMIVNMESGCYAGFPKGSVDAAVDAASAVPGDHAGEKMISGAYLGKVILQALRQAHEEGLLTANIPSGMAEIPMPHVNGFLAGEESVLDRLVRPEDKPLVREIILAVYGRTARLLAVSFGAVALHCGTGSEKPVCVVMEGSTYEKSPLLQAALAHELEALKKIYGIRFRITGARNATLTGAAFAAASDT